MQALQRLWVQIQHPLAHWNLRGGRWTVLNTVHEIHNKIPLFWDMHSYLHLMWSRTCLSGLDVHRDLFTWMRCGAGLVHLLMKCSRTCLPGLDVQQDLRRLMPACLSPEWRQRSSSGLAKEWEKAMCRDTWRSSQELTSNPRLTRANESTIYEFTLNTMYILHSTFRCYCNINHSDAPQLWLIKCILRQGF